MKIVHWGRARRFFKANPLAETPLRNWRALVKAANWNNFPDVQRTFTRASFVADKIVFNIQSNDYRLVAIAVFEKGTIYIRAIMDHKEYDEDKWKEGAKK